MIFTFCYIMNTYIKVSPEIGTLDATITFNNFDLLYNTFSVEVIKVSQTFILGGVCSL